MNRFKTHYDYIVCYDILFKDHFFNVMQLPKVQRIILNTGLGQKAILDRKQLLTTLIALESITGQKANITKAKKSIDKFKLREKMPIGCKVTLRSKNLYSFLDRLTNTVLPNLEDLTDLYINLQKKRQKPVLNQISKTPKFFPLSKFFFDSFSNSTEVTLNSILQKNFSDLSCDFSEVFLLISHNEINKNTKFCTTGFGIKDFFAFQEIPYDKFETSYGMDIIFILDSLKIHKYLSTPKYLLSSFQMPLYLL
jgi:ribosomal protein L5